jgi:hypothetical protein
VGSDDTAFFERVDLGGRQSEQVAVDLAVVLAELWAGHGVDCVGAVRLLTRTGLDWTHKYPPIAAAVASLGARRANPDGELCGVFPDGISLYGATPAPITTEAFGLK